MSETEHQEFQEFYWFACYQTPGITGYRDGLIRALPGDTRQVLVVKVVKFLRAELGSPMTILSLSVEPNQL